MFTVLVLLRQKLERCQRKWEDQISDVFLVKVNCKETFTSVVHWHFCFYSNLHKNMYNRAVYTGIKKTLSFSHIPVFSWKLLGKYP